MFRSLFVVRAAMCARPAVAAAVATLPLLTRAACAASTTTKASARGRKPKQAAPAVALDQPVTHAALSELASQFAQLASLYDARSDKTDAQSSDKFRAMNFERVSDRLSLLVRSNVGSGAPFTLAALQSALHLKNSSSVWERVVNFFELSAKVATF